MIKLRDYQIAAVDATLETLYDHPSCVIVAPTGAGKSLIIAELCRYVRTIGGRVLVVTHQHELVEQNAATISGWCNERVGVYCAMTGRKEVGKAITSASIASIYRKPELWGNLQLLIVDEAHRVHLGSDSMYDQLITEVKHEKLVGLTATPFRLGGGIVWGEGKPFAKVSYDIGIKSLIEAGYLAPPCHREGNQTVETSGVKIVNGDYATGEISDRVAQFVSHGGLADAMSLLRSRKSVLWFVPSVKCAVTLGGVLGESSEVLTNETDLDSRASALARFKNQSLRHLINVGILTTGFNAPATDAIVLLRPTKSTSLYIQMVGRGLRTSPGKKDCLVLDYARNIWTHGPIDEVDIEVQGEKARGGQITLWVCPTCYQILGSKTKTCPCGFQKTTKEVTRSTIESKASSLSAISGAPTWVPIRSISYSLHEKEGKPLSVKVSYCLEGGEVSEWVCPDHGGYATAIAQKWTKRRGVKLAPAKELLSSLQEGVHPCEVQIKREGKYWRIVDCVFGKDSPEVFFDSLVPWGTLKPQEEPELGFDPLDDIPF